MPPDIPSIRGRANIEAAYRARFPIVVGQLRMERIDFTHDGDHATAIGTSSLTPESTDERARTAHAKYIVVYRRYGDDRLIAYQITNYDEPLSR